MTRGNFVHTPNVQQVLVPENVITAMNELRSHLEDYGESVNKVSPYNTVTLLSIITQTRTLHPDLAISLFREVQGHIFPEVEMITLAKSLDIPIEVFEIDELYVANLFLVRTFILESFEFNDGDY